MTSSVASLTAELRTAERDAASAKQNAASAASRSKTAQRSLTTANTALTQARAGLKAATKALKRAKKRKKKKPIAAARKKLKAARTKVKAAESKVAAARKTATSAAAKAKTAASASAAANARVATLKSQIEDAEENANPTSTTAAPRLMCDRFTGGYTAAALAQITKAGSSKWFDAQLRPTTSEHATINALTKWFPNLGHTPQQRFNAEVAGTGTAYSYALPLGNSILLRRIHTQWPVREALTEFWSDHLHIPLNADGWFWRADYDTMIRSRAFGKFTDLLSAATFHPAMLFYLGNYSSTATLVNENHARELLELHTVGVGYYDEADVKGAGRIMSGWTVNPWLKKPTIKPWYNDTLHNTTPATVIGFKTDGSGRNGQTAKDFITALARHPNTARRLMTKLAIRFVSDTPSADLVAELVRVYLANDTAIKPVLRALVAHPEFVASSHQKVRTEDGDFVATMRALGVTVQAPTSAGHGANTLVHAYQAGLPYGWPRPDGRPDVAEAFANPGRILRSFTMHANLLGGYYPKGNMKYRTPKSFMPSFADSPTVAAIITHAYKLLTGRTPSQTLINAAAEAINASPSLRIKPTDSRVESLETWMGIRLLAPLLDNSAHLTH